MAVAPELMGDVLPLLRSLAFRVLSYIPGTKANVVYVGTVVWVDELNRYLRESRHVPGFTEVVLRNPIACQYVIKCGLALLQALEALDNTDDENIGWAVLQEHLPDMSDLLRGDERML